MTRSNILAAYLTLGLTAGFSPVVLAQEVPRSSGPCFSHPGRVGCSSWWVFELAGHLPLAVSSEELRLENATPEEYRAFGPHVSWDLGYMRRIAGRSAIGIVGMAGYGGPAERWAIKGRYAFDLPGSHSVDVSAGWLHAVVDGFGQRDGQGVTADLRLNRGDWLSAGLRYDRVSTDPLPGQNPSVHLFPTAQALYGGLTLRQRAGLYGTAGVGAILAGYVLLFWLAGPEE